MKKTMLSKALMFCALTLAVSPSDIEAAAAVDSLAAIEAKLNSKAKPTEADFETLGELIQREPKNARAHLLLGLAYEQVGLAKQAVEQYSEAVKLAPDDPKPIVDLVTARIRYKEPGDISGLIATAAKRFPTDPDILFLKGYDALKHDRDALADDCFRAAFKQKPDIPWLRVLYAELKLKHGQNQVALYFIKPALRDKTAPWYPRACEVAGLALINNKPPHYAEAVDFLGIAASNDITRSDLNEKVGTLAAWSGRYSHAIPPTLLCLASSTNAYNDHQKLCTVLTESLRRTNKEKALKDLDEIIQKFEPAQTNPYFHNVVGQVFDNMGWHDAAMVRYEYAIKLLQKQNSRDGRPYFNLAKDTELYARDYPKALTLYKQAQQLSLPPGVHIADYVTRLEDRMALGKQDLAWRLRNMLARPSQ